jgi:DNA repair exonuclease SbcCD ATPase subunit
MATRKTSRKKARASAKSAPKDDMIIEGVARPVDPEDMKGQSTSTKSKAKAKQKYAAPKISSLLQNSRMAMIIALAGLFVGITGAGLGGLAYIGITSQDRTADLQAMIEDSLQTTLAPAFNDIEELKNRIDSIIADQDNRITAADLTDLENGIARLDSDLSALRRTVQENVDKNIASLQEHVHDGLVEQKSLTDQLNALRQDIDNLQTKARNLTVSPESTQTQTTKQKPDNEGWWTSLKRAFSITRIDPAQEGTE